MTVHGLENLSEIANNIIFPERVPKLKESAQWLLTQVA